MEARIKNMQTILNDAWGPMVTLGKCLATSPVPDKTRELVHIRTAQINGCAVCLDGHVAKSKETPQRLGAVASRPNASPAAKGSESKNLNIESNAVASYPTASGSTP